MSVEELDFDEVITLGDVYEDFDYQPNMPPAPEHLPD